MAQPKLLKQCVFTHPCANQWLVAVAAHFSSRGEISNKTDSTNTLDNQTSKIQCLRCAAVSSMGAHGYMHCTTKINNLVIGRGIVYRWPHLCSYTDYIGGWRSVQYSGTPLIRTLLGQNQSVLILIRGVSTFQGFVL